MTKACRKGNRDWKKFSLRTLLIATTLFALLSIASVRYWHQYRFAKGVISRGGFIKFHSPAYNLTENVGWFFRDIETVDFVGTRSELGDFAELSRLPRLHRLVLNRCDFQRDEFGYIAKCRELKRLELQGTSASDENIQQLAELQQLEELDICGTYTTENCLKSIQNYTSLRQVSFDFFLTDVGLEILASSPSMLLRPLKLKGVSDEGIRNFKRLNSSKHSVISMETNSMTDLGVSIAFEKGNNQSFESGNVLFGGSQITSSCLSHIPWQELASIRFQNSGVNPVDVAKAVGNQTAMLSIGARSITFASGTTWPFGDTNRSRIVVVEPSGDCVFECAEFLPQLEFLSFDKAESIAVRDAFRKSSKIKHVFARTPLPLALMDELGQLNQLDSLEIHWTGTQAQVDLQPLAQLPKLRSIKFFSCPISGAAMEPLGRLLGLRELELLDCKFEQSVIESFPNFPHLRVQYRHEKNRVERPLVFAGSEALR